MWRSDMKSWSMRTRWPAVAVLLSATTACAAPSPAEPETSTGSDLVTCAEPRPEVCTMQYEPVCARLGDGEGAEWKTYPSGCTACGDAEVSAYRPGGECN